MKKLRNKMKMTKKVRMHNAIAQHKTTTNDQTHKKHIARVELTARKSKLMQTSNAPNGRRRPNINNSDLFLLKYLSHYSYHLSK